MSSWTVVTPPAAEPLSVADIAAHLRLDASNREPAPGAPVVALAGVGAGTVTVGAHRYAITFVTAIGETDAGAQTTSVTVADTSLNGKVQLSDIPLGGAAVLARKIYRTLAAGTSLFLVATINDNTTTSYLDNAADGSLTTAAPSANTTDDPFLLSLITAAREYCETFLSRSLVTQALRVTYDRFPSCDVLALPRPNLRTVTSITYVDTTGASQTLSASMYAVDATALPGRVVLTYGNVWPSTRSQRNAVTVDYTAGYGLAAAVPESIKHAMRLHVGHAFANREGADLPRAIDMLLWPHRFVEA